MKYADEYYSISNLDACKSVDTDSLFSISKHFYVQPTHFLSNTNVSLLKQDFVHNRKKKLSTQFISKPFKNNIYIGHISHIIPHQLTLVPPISTKVCKV